MTTHLLPMGGGGYYGPKGGPSRLMLYFLKLTRKKHPKVCLIPTATGDKPETIHQFMHCINHFGAHPNYLSLFSLPTNDLEDWLMDFDAVYVSGGNTKTMLGAWREWKLDRLLIRAWKRGIVMSGSSAGANCWYENNLTDSYATGFDALPGMGVVPGSCCPHYADEKGWRPAYLDMVKRGKLKNGFGMSNRASIHYVNGTFHEALIEFEEAGVYRVERKGNRGVTETKLEARMV